MKDTEEEVQTNLSKTECTKVTDGGKIPQRKITIVRAMWRIAKIEGHLKEGADELVEDQVHQKFTRWKLLQVRREGYR